MELVEAEYLAGVEAVRGRHPAALLSVLWLGSSVGNFSAAEAPEFLQALRRRAGPRSQLLLGADLWKDAGVLRAAYQDHKGGVPAGCCCVPVQTSSNIARLKCLLVRQPWHLLARSPA